MNPAVSISNLHKSFARPRGQNPVQALNGVEFDIPRGAFFGLLGPNGAGKSTLINIVAGLTRADEGEVQVLSHDVVRDYRMARAALGIVPQELVYDPFFTVREILHLQSGYFGMPRSNRAWIEELLDILNLSEQGDTNLQALSGGMKRRVLIALALVHKPQVVVLDEPTAGVDTELRHALWKFTKRLHQAGHTIVLTTHYLEEAEALCERIAILNHGRVVALDSKSGLLARYPYRLLCLTLNESARALPEQLMPLVTLQDGARLNLRLHRERDSIGSVLETLRGAGFQILDLHTEDAGLEEVFIGLTASTSVGARSGDEPC